MRLRRVLRTTLAEATPSLVAGRYLGTIVDMAIGVSPQRLREVRFAEQWRGYRTEEVDEFVERVAEAFDTMEERLRETAERAAQAERALSERGAEESVSRTLVLAQRTADAAVREAEAEAARLVAEAQERARAVVAEAEKRAADQQAELEARAASALQDLAERRRALESDVLLLRTYVRDYRAALIEDLGNHLAWLETNEHLPPPPIDGPWSSAAADAVRAPGGEPPVGRTPGAEADQPAAGDELEQLAFRAEALRRGLSSAMLPALLGDDENVGPRVPLGDGAQGDAAGPKSAGDGEPAASPLPSQEAPSGDMEDIAWRRPPDDDGDVSSPPLDDDPFIAELRRAVHDSEPLGPRDDDGLWVDDAGITPPASTPPSRFLRRRGRM
ncbi:MAG TPA: DivIVA domain-containing protein [Acidimicrobiales bacterium]|nr:DivIVA domain-containing protein [Acidimicrobiales bacterium]